MQIVIQISFTLLLGIYSLYRPIPSNHSTIVTIGWLRIKIVERPKFRDSETLFRFRLRLFGSKM